MGFLSSAWKNIVAKPVSQVTNTVSNFGSQIDDEVRRGGRSLDRGVRDNVPGGWGTLAAIGGGMYFAPELSAMFASSPETIAATEATAAGEAGSMAGAVSAPVTTGSVAATDLGTLAGAPTSSTTFGGGITGAGGVDYAAAGGPGSYGYDMGATAMPDAAAVGNSTNSGFIGADYEQMPGNGMFGGSAVNAPLQTSSFGLSDLGSGAWQGIKDNKLATAMVGSSLYDMYAKRQMAKQQESLYNQNRSDIMNMYAPGSPEAIAMEREMARKDAAAGRNSQYGIRATDYAGNVAKFKTNALSNAQSAQNGLAAAQMGNQYGGLNSMFNNLAMYSLMNKNTR
jgi:hypothetical protein